ncbi:MAG: hypothetical protein IJS42_03590 [Synergistaceae bacterium]|nr:hypothetical protein [Synergistaceae bacterium]
MTRTQMLAMLRKVINDEQATGFTEGGNLEQPEGTQELIHYLDRAVDVYSNRQAASKDIRLMKTMNVSNGSRVPNDFIALCGAVPVNINSGVISFYGEGSPMNARYFARLPYVSSYSDTATLPYEHDQYMNILSLAAAYALNKHEFNVSQDLALLGLGGVQNADSQQ